MAITTTSTLPSPVQQTFNMKLLAVPVPYLIMKIPAMKEKLPRNGGNTMRFRRYNPLVPSTVPLGNSGITPPSQNLTALDIDAQISWYGQWLEINEQVVLQNQEAVLNEAAIRLGVAMRETEDLLVSTMLATTATQINCVYGTNGQNPTNLTKTDIDNVVKTLLGASAHMFTDNIEGDLKFGTSPVRPSYIALAHTDLTSNLNNVQNFINSSQYPNQQRVLDGEWGSVDNMRFLVSQYGSISANASSAAQNVYNIFCCAKESYAVVDQEGATPIFIYRPAVYSGPLAQNVTVGYKFAQVPRLLNDAWLANLRATLS